MLLALTGAALLAGLAAPSAALKGCRDDQPAKHLVRVAHEFESGAVPRSSTRDVYANGCLHFYRDTHYVGTKGCWWSQTPAPEMKELEALLESKGFRDAMRVQSNRQGVTDSLVIVYGEEQIYSSWEGLLSPLRRLVEKLDTMFGKGLGSRYPRLLSSSDTALGSP